MDASRHDAAGETPTQLGHNGESTDQSAATLFTAFGVGRSYIFHVNEAGRGRAHECWEEVFAGRKGWGFERLKKYDKPLGETATFTLSAENCEQAGAPIEELRAACENRLSPNSTATGSRRSFSPPAWLS